MIEYTVGTGTWQESITSAGKGSKKETRMSTSYQISSSIMVSLLGKGQTFWEFHQEPRWCAAPWSTEQYSISYGLCGRETTMQIIQNVMSSKGLQLRNAQAPIGTTETSPDMLRSPVSATGDR